MQPNYPPPIPSICISRMYSNITRRDVTSTFESILGKGCVDRIDMLLKRDGMQPYQCVFVHFNPSFTHTTRRAAYIAERLNKGMNIKIVYNDPWFWKCTMLMKSN